MCVCVWTRIASSINQPLSGLYLKHLIANCYPLTFDKTAVKLTCIKEMVVLMPFVVATFVLWTVLLKTTVATPDFIVKIKTQA